MEQIVWSRTMKLLVPLVFLIAFFGIPSETLSQEKGKIIGKAFARDRGKGKSSLLIAVRNRCEKKPCKKQPIDKVTVTIKDKRLRKNQTDPVAHYYFDKSGKNGFWTFDKNRLNIASNKSAPRFVRTPYRGYWTGSKRVDPIPFNVTHQSD